MSVVVRNLDKREASQFYSQLTVTYTGDRPTSFPPSDTFELLTPPK